MDKKYLIIGGVGLAVAALYLLSKRKSGDTTEVAQQAALGAFSAGFQENVAARTNDELSSEQAEYNAARQEYYKVYNAYPKSSWTLEQIKTAISDGKEIAELIKTYKMITDDSLEVDTTGMSALKLQELIAESEDRNLRKKVGQVVDAFIATLKPSGSLDYTKAIGFKKQPIDSYALNQMLAMTQHEKEVFVSVFQEKGGVTMPRDCGLGDGQPSKYTQFLSVYSALTTKGTQKRPNADLALKVAEAFANINPA